MNNLLNQKGKKKITNSRRLSSIEQYLFGFDLDGKRLNAGNQDGMSLRARLQENITGYAGRLNTYTIEEVLNRIDGLNKDLQKIKDVQTLILTSIIASVIGAVAGAGLSYFL